MDQFYLEHIPSLYSSTEKEEKKDNKSVEEKTLKELIEDSDVVLTDQEAYQLAYKIFNKMDTKTENVTETSKSFYYDLEIFGGNKSDKFNSIFNQLDKTHSNLGKIMMQHRISNPIDSVDTLSHNQLITETLLDNTQLYHSLQKYFINVNESEKDVIWFWKDKNAELKELFSMVYFNSYFFKFLNNYETVLKWYNYLKIIVYPVYGLISPLLYTILPYLVSKYMLKLPITFWGYLKMTYQGVTDNRLISIFFPDVSPNIIKIAQYSYMFMMLSLYLYNLYMTFEVAYNLNKIINMIHKKVNKLAMYVINCFNIYNLTKDLIPCKNEEKIIMIQPLFRELWDALFQQEPGLISDKGKILKTFHMFDHNKDELIALMQYVAEVDTHLNVAKLVSHNGYQLVNYIKSERPYVNIKGLWNVSIDKNKIVSNDIQIGGFGIKESKEQDKIEEVIVEEVIVEEVNVEELNIDEDDEINDDKEVEELDIEEDDIDDEDEIDDENDGVDDEDDNKIVNIPSNLLITGPNAAGKSTFIKSVALAILLSQTLAIAPVQNMEMSCFRYLSTYLNIPDTKGEKSLFQAEMEQVVEHMNKLKGLKDNEFSFIIMDELFNSTNYYEGVCGAYGVGKKLTRYPNNMTILTTHYNYLTKLSETNEFENYYFDAQLDNGTVLCDYKIKKGKSNKGIALELMKLKGFDEDISNDASEAYEDLLKV